MRFCISGSKDIRVRVRNVLDLQQFNDRVFRVSFSTAHMVKRVKLVNVCDF